jgi:hypothetical protein
MSNKLPVATLDMSYFSHALTAVYALAQQFTNAQASMIPIIVHVESISAFVPATPTTTGGRSRTVTPGAVTTGEANPTHKVATKRNEGTPEGGVLRDLEHQSKKKRCNATNKKEIVMKDMGTFYLKDPNSRKTVFPSGTYICPNFACKGRKCTAENCVLDHPQKPGDIKKEEIEDIAKCFHRTDQDWLSHFHFSFMKELSDEAKAMMGGPNGINNSKTD